VWWTEEKEIETQPSFFSSVGQNEVKKLWVGCWPRSVGQKNCGWTGDVISLIILQY
jgi:hypothetical protein